MMNIGQFQHRTSTVARFFQNEAEIGEMRRAAQPAAKSATTAKVIAGTVSHPTNPNAKSASPTIDIPSAHVHVTRIIKRGAAFVSFSQSHHGKATVPIRKKISRLTCVIAKPSASRVKANMGVLSSF